MLAPELLFLYIEQSNEDQLLICALHWIYTSPYYKAIEDELLVTDIGNETILHIIRLMANGDVPL